MERCPCCDGAGRSPELGIKCLWCGGAGQCSRDTALRYAKQRLRAVEGGYLAGDYDLDELLAERALCREMFERWAAPQQPTA